MHHTTRDRTQQPLAAPLRVIAAEPGWRVAFVHKDIAAGMAPSFNVEAIDAWLDDGRGKR